MLASISTLATIIEESDKLSFIENPDLESMKPFLLTLNQAVKSLKGQDGAGGSFAISVEDYDADTEVREDKLRSKR